MQLPVQGKEGGSTELGTQNTPGGRSEPWALSSAGDTEWLSPGWDTLEPAWWSGGPEKSF